MALSNRDPLAPSSSRDPDNESLEDIEEVHLQRRSCRARREVIASDLEDSETTLDGVLAPKSGTIVNRAQLNGDRKFDPNVHFSDVSTYPRCNVASTITYAITSRFLEDYNFPAGYEITVPRSANRIYNRPEGVWIGLSRWAFHCGLHFPLHPFYFEILDVLGISLGQLCPNAFTQVYGFLAMCKRCNISP